MSIYFKKAVITMRAIWLVILFLSITLLSACRTDKGNDWFVPEDDGLKETLVVETVARRNQPNHLLNQKIMKFADAHPNLEVDLRHHNLLQASKWTIGQEEPGDPPDILELTPTQMKILFYHNKIEALNISERQYQDYLLYSPEGYAYGVKTKINPLIIYYNKDIFLKHGLEFPTKEWDWDQFEQTIAILKEKGENVYIPVTPHFLEWVTMNGYGGRIADTSGTVFSGYLDSEAAIQAAEWLFWIHSVDTDYKFRQGLNTYWPMPYDLLDNNMALTVQYAYYLEDPGISNYMYYGDITESNEQISIAPLPGGNDAKNPALMTGLAIHKQAKNKDAAMKLLRYLLEESDDFYRDTIIYTHQSGGAGELTKEGDEGWPVVLYEAGRSVPATLMTNEGEQWENRRFIIFDLHLAMINGQPPKEVLERYAFNFDLQFELFKEDLNNFYLCLKQNEGICRNL